MNIKLVNGLRVTVVLAVLILLVTGHYREHKVLDNPKEEYGLHNYVEISEYQLVEDATFSGTIRKWGRLFSTYDRTVPKGKMACPT
jgi:hypothetical protein